MGSSRKPSPYLKGTVYGKCDPTEVVMMRGRKQKNFDIIFDNID